MSGPGLPRFDIGAGDSRSKKSATAAPALSPEEKAKRMAERNVVLQQAADKKASRDAASLVPPDLADIALRDVSSGKVRKVRAGSTRDSILGSAMQFIALLGVVGWAWLKAAWRGEL